MTPPPGESKSQQSQNSADALFSRVENSLKELQVMSLDIAVLKNDISTVKENVEKLFKNLFDGTDKRGGLIESVIRIEDDVQSIKDANLRNRVNVLEQNKVDVSKCVNTHSEVSNRMWKILIPIIVITLTSMFAVVFADIYKSRESVNLELDKYKQSMQQLIEQELQKISQQRPTAVSP